ncbi:MAG: hypothetical protein GWP91_03900 [Rhodobacterales bacterium]|nr:hypothetical protein [Rhodobacterales bacterium]
MTMVTTPPTTTTTVTTSGGTACAPLPPMTWSSMSLTYPGEEFAFDRDGNFVTVSDQANGAWQMTRDLTWTLTSPFESEEVAGLDLQEDGTIVIADEANGALYLLGTDGALNLLLGSINSPNSIAVHNNGDIYVTAFDRVLRVDPLTGAFEELAAFPGQDLDGLAFSPDFTTLYFNLDAAGDIYSLPIEGGDTTFVAGVTVAFGGAELDGMTTDECGNLYAIRTDGRISRITADGTKLGNFLKLEGAQYTSALHFGSGVGGWERDHLYVMDRYGTLFDIDIGINGAQEPHLKGI